MILFSLVFVFFGSGWSQENSKIEGSTVFFAQGMMRVPSDEVGDLQSKLRNLEFLKVVRLDELTSRFFILTHAMDQLTIDQVESWFGEFGGELYCIQIGIQGLDVPEPYPFKNCD